MGGLVAFVPLPFCHLASWRHRCGGGAHEHHIVSRGKLQKNAAARLFCEREHPEIFLVTICGNANVSRLADSKEAQAILLAGKVALFGEEYVRGVWDEFVTLWRGPALRIDGLLSHLPEDAPRPIAVV